MAEEQRRREQAERERDDLCQELEAIIAARASPQTASSSRVGSAPLRYRCPLGDGFVLYLRCLLGYYLRLLLPSIVFFYPEEAPCIPRSRVTLIHPSAWKGYSANVALTEF